MSPGRTTSTRKSDFDLTNRDDHYDPLSDACDDYFGRVEPRKRNRNVTEASSPPLVAGEALERVRKVKKAAGNFFVLLWPSIIYVWSYKISSGCC